MAPFPGSVILSLAGLEVEASPVAAGMDDRVFDAHAGCEEEGEMVILVKIRSLKVGLSVVQLEWIEQLPLWSGPTYLRALSGGYSSLAGFVGEDVYTL